MKKPSLASILFGLIPFAAICVPLSFWDRVHPMILGLPFNFFWLLSWLLLTPICMLGAYRFDRPHVSDTRRDSRGEVR